MWKIFGFLGGYPILTVPAEILAVPAADLNPNLILKFLILLCRLDPSNNLYFLGFILSLYRKFSFLF